MVLRRWSAALSRTERFFKAAIFPGLDAKAPFDTAIKGLKSIGINGEGRDSIHALRELYNAAKRNPSAQTRFKVANDVLSSARKALETIIHEGPGQVRAPVSAAVSRLLWVSGYDHYTGGCTSVSWEPLLSDLVSSCNFYYGRDHFEDDVYARFNEDDFINAGIWDGDYRQLITISARHEHHPLKDEVIPNFRRDHWEFPFYQQSRSRLPT